MQRVDARTVWSWEASGETPTCEQLRTMATIETVRALDEVCSRLDRILSRLDTLGTDGIHEVIREARQQARAKRRKRLATKRVGRAA